MSQIHRRTAVAVALTGAFAFGGTSAALADATPTTPATPAAATTPPWAIGGGHGHVAAGGIFKAVFDVFGAVRTQAPAVAAPVIAQGVTAGTITQAEADQLTALFTATGPAAGFGGHAAGASGADRPSFSAGQRTVLHQAMQAVAAQLPTIAKTPLDADVTAGTITQSDEDLILKVLGVVSQIKLPTPSATTTDPAAGLQQAATHRVASAVTKKARHAKKHASKARSHR